MSQDGSENSSEKRSALHEESANLHVGKRRKLCELGTGEVVHLISYTAKKECIEDFERLVQEFAGNIYGMKTGITDVRVCHPRCGAIVCVITFLSKKDLELFKTGPQAAAEKKLLKYVEGSQSSFDISGSLMPHTYNLAGVLDMLRRKVRGTSHEEHDVRAVTKELGMWFPRPCEYMKYVSFDRADPTKYTRNLVFSSEHMDVIMMCWPPGSKSTIHDHDQSSCWVVMVEGTVTEVQYMVPTLDRHFIESEMRNPTGAIGRCGDLRVVTETKLEAGGVTSTYVNNDISIHRIENRTDQPAYTLHCYAPPLSKMKIFSETGEVTVKCMSACEPYHSVDGVTTELGIDVDGWNQNRSRGGCP